MERKHVVLAVEDDIYNFQLMRAILDGLPLQIVNAPSGEDAVAFLTTTVPDLIILDINLPDMHGWQVLERFKDDPRFSESIVIVLTARTEPVHRLIGSLMPISAYLNKPIQPDQLRQLVRQSLKLDG